MAWSRNARLFAWEQDRGGCLPLDSFVDVLFKRMKYTGYVSMEVFSKDFFDKSANVPEMLAARGMMSRKESMKKIEG